MLNNGAFPWKNWSTGELVTETDFQNIHDSLSNADKVPFWIKTWENYIWWRNTKDLHTMSAWSGAVSSTSVTVDSTNALTNNLAIRSTVTSTSGNTWCGFYNDPWSTQNMLQLNEGVTLTPENIGVCFSFYIADVTKWQYVYFRFGQDSSNFYYTYYAQSELITGWNIKIRHLDSFHENNSPTGWGNIDYFYCYAIGINANIQNQYWIADQITLVRRDLNNYPFPFQISDGQTSETWTNLMPSLGSFMMFTNEYYSNQELGLIRPNSGVYTRWGQLDNNLYKEFYAKAWMRCKITGNSTSLCWYVDSLNYVSTYVEGSVFKLANTIGGVTTTKTVNLLETLTKNWNFNIKLYKFGTTVIAEVEGEHTKPRVLTTYVATTESGTLNFGSPFSNAISFIRDWNVGHKPNDVIRQGTVSIT